MFAAGAYHWKQHVVPCQTQALPTFGPARNITRLGLGLRTAAGGSAALGNRRGEAPIEVDLESQPSGSGEANVSSVSIWWVLRAFVFLCQESTVCNSAAGSQVTNARAWI